MQMSILPEPHRHDAESDSMNTALLAGRRCKPTGSMYLYFLAAVASVGGFLFGYDTGVVSGAMELIRREWGLDDVQHEAIVSSTTGFAAVGAACSGLANRILGRKPVLIGAAVVFTVGALTMGFARNVGELLFGRCVVGLAVGLASSTVPLYLAELAPPSMRGLLVSVNNSCIVVGQVCAAIVDGLFSGVPQTGWRWMLGLGGIPSAIQLVGMLFLPESPRWLLSKGREAEARAVLRKLRRAERSPGRTRPASDSSPAANPAAAASGTAASSSRRAAMPSSSDPDPEHNLDTIVDREVEEILEALALTGAQPVPRAGGGRPLGETTTTPSRAPDTPSAPAADVAAPASSTAADGSIQRAQRAEPTIHSAPTALATPGTPATPAAPVLPARPTNGGGGGVTIADLWAVRRQLTLGVGLLVLQQMIGINTVMYYSVSILLQAHVGTVRQSIWLAVPVASAQLVGCIIGGLAIDRVGRRPLALVSLIGVSVSLALEGFVFLLDGSICNATSTAGAPAAGANASLQPDGHTADLAHGSGDGALDTLCAFKGWVTVGGLIVYLLCFGIGMSPVPWAVNAEIYPLRVRGVCMGIATASNWTMNFVVAATFLSLQDWVSKPGAFWLYGVVAVFGAIWLCSSMPETSGRSLEQIEELFNPRRARALPIITVRPTITT